MSPALEISQTRAENPTPVRNPFLVGIRKEGAVTLDLNGFVITGPDTGFGVLGIDFGGPLGQFPDITVFNGTIRDTGRDGVRLGDQARVEKLTLLNNDVGIEVGSDSMLLDNVVRDGSGCDFAVLAGDGSVLSGNTISNHGTGHGVAAFNGSLIINNTITGNFRAGIFMQGFGTLVTGNAVHDNGDFGLNVFSGLAAIGNNAFTFNNGGNANPQVSGVFVQVAANLCGTNTSC